MYRRCWCVKLLPLLFLSLQGFWFAPSARAAATATFDGTDTTTQGNWQGTYGTDGSILANVTPANPPSYDTNFAVQGQINYTWTASTSDPRAVEYPEGRIAAAWYSTGPFTFSVDLTDGQPHILALYALDWDSQGRSETITLSDAVSQAQLDTETVSNFTGGSYLIWTVSGNITVTVSGLKGPNAVISGAFFGSKSGSAESVTVSPSVVGLDANGTQQFTATVLNGSSQTVSWSINSVTPSGAAPGGISATGVYTAPATVTAGEQVTIMATSADQQASGTATVNLSAGSVANWIGFDASTQGNWEGVYGTDGYAIEGETEDVPGYANFSVSNELTYTWAGSTTDPRALEVPGGTSRIAAAWYSIHDAIPPTFSFDINLTDGQSHQVAFYALDWDSQGRAETVQIVDANTQAQLDTRTVSSFVGGTYLVWNITGHVIVNVTETVGPNCVISGVFFGKSTASAINVSVSPSSVGLNANQTQQFTATVTGTTNTAVNWLLSPSSGSGTISTSGLYTAPSTLSNGQAVTVTAQSQQDTTRSGTATVNLTTGGVGNYLATDTSTEGSWQGIYGGDGYAIAGDPPNDLPSYVTTFAVNGAQTYTWNGNTTDSRALQMPGASGRIAAAWYTSPTFTINVTVSDGKLHEFALYALDWDSQGRAETIQILDQATNNVLDTRSISSFTNGVYLVWNISGSIIVNVTSTAGPNAVINGAFFGGGTGLTVNVTPGVVTLAGGQTQQFTATFAGPTQTVTWSISPSTGAGAISSTGFYTAPQTIATAQTVTVTATPASGSPGTATINLTPGATATFVGFDTATQGNWEGTYGTSAGYYSLAGDNQSLPSWATFSVSNLNGIWVWTDSTTDPRALEAVSYSGRIAACWYKNHDSFTISVDFTDGNPHKLALYALDWDSQGRSESIAILDATTGAVLNTQSLSNFTNGIYAVWTVTGSITVNITVTGGANAVISGAFFQ
jgi:hypothetical protein